MAEQTKRSRAKETGSQVYQMALRITAALVVLLTFAGLAYLVTIERIDGGPLLLYAGVILGYILRAATTRAKE